jgi:hypothetical protein
MKISHADYASRRSSHSPDSAGARRSSRRDAHIQARIAHMDPSNLSSFSLPTLRRLAKDMGLADYLPLSKPQLVVRLMTEILVAAQANTRDRRLGGSPWQLEHIAAAHKPEHKSSPCEADLSQQVLYRFDQSLAGKPELIPKRMLQPSIVVEKLPKELQAEFKQHLKNLAAKRVDSAQHEKGKSVPQAHCTEVEGSYAVEGGQKDHGTHSLHQDTQIPVQARQAHSGEEQGSLPAGVGSTAAYKSNGAHSDGESTCAQKDSLFKSLEVWEGSVGKMAVKLPNSTWAEPTSASTSGRRLANGVPVALQEGDRTWTGISNGAVCSYHILNGSRESGNSSDCAKHNSGGMEGKNFRFQDSSSMANSHSCSLGKVLFSEYSDVDQSSVNNQASSMSQSSGDERAPDIDIDGDFESLAKLDMEQLQHLCEELGIMDWPSMRKADMISTLLSEAYGLNGERQHAAV